MPAESKSQQRLFAAALAYKRGELKDASDKVKELAASMSESELEDFAATPHEGLPDKKAATAQIQGGLLQVPLIKTARNKFMKMYQMGKLSLGGLQRTAKGHTAVDDVGDLHAAFKQPRPKKNMGWNIETDALQEFRRSNKLHTTPELDIRKVGLGEPRPAKFSGNIENLQPDANFSKNVNTQRTWGGIGGFYQGPQHASRYRARNNTVYMEGFLLNRKSGRPAPMSGYAGVKAHEYGHAKQWADPQRAKNEAGILYRRLQPSLSQYGITGPKPQQILSEMGGHWNATAGNSYGARAAKKLPILRASQPQLARMRETIPGFDNMSSNLQRRLLAVRSHLAQNYSARLPYA